MKRLKRVMIMMRLRVKNEAKDKCIEDKKRIKTALLVYQE